MSFFWLTVCLALLLFGAVNALGSLFVVLLYRRRLASRGPRTAARSILLRRLIPAALSLFFVAALFLPAFLRYEPRETDERVSASLLALAAGGALVLLAGPVRALQASLATHHLARGWERNASPASLPGLDIPAWIVEETFPIVTVVGILRPRLYIARQVVDGCTRTELEAIAAHEAGHLKNRDNLKRLLLRSLPDWISLIPRASRMERVWARAIEEDADDHAARAAGSLDLASALLKVARMVSLPPPRHLSAHLYGEGGTAWRVERLLGAPGLYASSCARRVALWPPIFFGLLACAPLIALCLGLNSSIHALAEAIVQLLQ